MASGVIAEGGSATATRPGVNELRIEAGGKPNESTKLSLRLPGTSRMRRTNNAYWGVSAKPVSMPTSSSSMSIITSFLNHPFVALFTEELPERLAPADWLKKWTHEEIDAGADIIVMHGAPLIHGVEIYHNRPIFSSNLGNFHFQCAADDIPLDEPINWESVVAHVQFQGKNLQAITLQPIAMNTIGQGEPDTRRTSTPITSSSKRAACRRRPPARKQAIYFNGSRTPRSPSEQKLGERRYSADQSKKRKLNLN